MDPRYFSIVTSQFTYYGDELEHERRPRDQAHEHKTSQPRFSFFRLRQAPLPATAPRCEPTATEAC